VSTKATGQARPSALHGVSARLVLPLAQGLKRLGADVQPFVAQLGEGDTLDETRVLAFLERLSAELGDPVLGLAIARASPMGTFGFIDYCTMTSPTLEDAIARVARYVCMLTDRVQIALEVRGGEATIVRTLKADALHNRHLSEFTMAIIAERCRDIVGAAMTFREVSFAHAPAAEVERYEAFFGAPVRFGAAKDALTFDAALLGHTLKTADPYVGDMLDAHARRLTVDANGRDAGLDDLRRKISARLSDGTPTLTELAKATGTSTRTLQRRLLERGTSLRKLVDDVRRETALELLLRPDTEISEVCFVLGFADPAPFYRAFRRWTGTTPQKYRVSGGGASPTRPIGG
jgi:AraC-like DNA-binding protein